jgi:hypothetical protein
MGYEERTVIRAPVEPVPVRREVVEVAPATYIEQRPVHRRVFADDPVGTAWAASLLIQTVVWAVAVIVLLIVGLLALHVYAGLF